MHSHWFFARLKAASLIASEKGRGDLPGSPYGGVAAWHREHNTFALLRAFPRSMRLWWISKFIVFVHLGIFFPYVLRWLRDIEEILLFFP